MSTTMKSAVHFGCETQQNLIACSLFLDESSNQVGEKQKCTSTQFHCLCLGKMHDHSEANEKRKSQISVFQQDKEYAELSGIDGEPI